MSVACKYMLLGLVVAALLSVVPQAQSQTFDLPDWVQKIDFSGAIEVEGFYTEFDSDNDADTDESNIALATVELSLSVPICDWITGEAVWLFEEDDTEPGEFDVAFIRLGNEEINPAYFEAGRIYPPFGNFESNFITDPVIVELGEMQESAVRLGAILGPVDVSVAVFNGDVNESDEDDDHIEDVVPAISAEHELDGLVLSGGAAYTTNIADSNAVTDELALADEVEDKVGGLNLWASVSYDRFGFLAEYVGATDDFGPGDLEFTDGEKAKPESWNFEGHYNATDRLTLAAKFETGNDVFGFQPDERYGACGSYVLFEDDLGALTLSLEVLKDDFENGDEATSVTSQLAFEF